MSDLDSKDEIYMDGIGAKRDPSNVSKYQQEGAILETLIQQQTLALSHIESTERSQSMHKSTLVRTQADKPFDITMEKELLGRMSRQN
jgi:hypothetical protein